MKKLYVYILNKAVLGRYYLLITTLSIFLLSAAAEEPSANSLILTAEEQEYIRNNPSFTVGNEMDWPPYDFNELGIPKGLCIDFVKMLAEKAGLTIDFFIGRSWPEILTRFKNNQIDVLPVLYKFPEREEYALFSKAYRKSRIGLFTSSDNNNIKSILDLKDKKIGMIAEAGYLPVVMNLIPHTTLLKYETQQQLAAALEEHVIDAAADNLLVLSYMAKHLEKFPIKLVSEIKIPVQEDMYFYLGIAKDKPLLQSILNKAIDSISVEQIEELNKKWLYAKNDDIYNSGLHLTPKEIGYISNHPVIWTSNESAYVPYDFNTGNTPKGFSVDLLNILAEDAGLKIEYINTTWKKLLNMFKDGQLDLMHTVSKLPERAKYGLFSLPYCRYQTHFFTRKGAPEILSISALYGKKVVAEKGWGLATYIKNNHPQVKLIEVDTSEEKFDALASGTVYAATGGDLSGAYMIARMGIKNVKVNSQFIEYDQSKPSKFYFMAQKDSPELISIINKALLNINPEKLKRLNAKWFGTSEVSTELAELTTEEKDFISQNPEITLAGGLSFGPFVQLDNNGGVTGHDAELAELVYERTGLKINITLNKWADSVKKAENGEVDGLLTSSNIAQRKQYFLPSTPYIKIQPLIIVKKDNPKKILSFKDLAGKTASFQEGNGFKDMLEEDISDVNIKYYPTIDGVIKAVVSEEVDFTFLDQTAFYIAQNLGIGRMIEAPFSIGDPFFLYFQTTKDKPLLQSIINKGLAKITHSEKQKIRTKWFGTSNIPLNSKKSLIELTPEEQAYLDNKGGLTYVVNPSHMPFDGVLDNNVHIGITADYIELFAERLRTEFILENAQSWAKSQDKLKNNMCDLAAMRTSSVTTIPGINFTSPYCSFPNVVMTRGDVSVKKDFKDEQDKTFIIIDGNPILERLLIDYPDLKIITVNKIEEALDSVQAGKAFGFIDTLANIQYATKKMLHDNLKVSYTLPLTTDFALAASSKDPILRGILQKAIINLSPADHERINSKWHAVTIKSVTDYTLLKQMTIIVAIIIIIILIWNGKLKLAKIETEKALNTLQATQVQLIQAEKMSSLGQLISGIAHEINTPLGAIQASSENILLAMTEVLQTSMSLYHILTPEEYQLFIKLINNANTMPQQYLTTKESRKKLRQLDKTLIDSGIAKPRYFSEIILQMRLTDKLDNFYPLILHDKGEFIMNTAYKIFSVIDNANNIDYAVNRASKIIFALRSYSHHSLEGDKSIADLQGNIETVLTLYQHSFKLGIKLIRNYHNIPPVECYPDQLGQVWTNLIHNALHSMNNNGELEITITREGDYAIVTIKDTGHGIPAEIHDKLFEPFFTTKKSGEGTGLGLDIVKKIIDKHNGKITFTSIENQGTAFTVSLPYNHES